MNHDHYMVKVKIVVNIFFARIGNQNIHQRLKGLHRIVSLLKNVFH